MSKTISIRFFSKENAVLGRWSTKDNSDIGFTVGVGAKLFYLGNKSLSIDYTYKTMGILGNVQMYTVGLSF